MHYIFTTLVAVLLLVRIGHGLSLEKRYPPGVRHFHNTTTGIYFVEHTINQVTPVFRIAVPRVDTPPQPPPPPFEVVLQIISPLSVTWAGFAWGGRMGQNPLTVVWPNGEEATVSSRWSPNRSYPEAYPDAKVKVISNWRNATHWTVELACKGCSHWNNNASRLMVSWFETHKFAWATGSGTPVAEPWNPDARFGKHTAWGTFDCDLHLAINPDPGRFSEYVRDSPGSWH